MKIFLLSPPWIPLPPSGYGGIETVVFNLSEGLQKKGHQVITFCTGDSRISSELRYFYKKSLGVDLLLEKSFALYFLNHIYNALKDIPSDVDILHNHCEMPAMHLLDSVKIPFVHTLHGLLPKKEEFQNEKGETISFSLRANYEILNMFKKHPFVSISNDQRKAMPDLNFVGNVYNSVDTSQYRFDEFVNEGEMLWLGRYSPQKGLDQAIGVAKQTNKKLVIAVRIHGKRAEQFKNEIQPQIDGQHIICIGEIEGQDKKNSLLNKSRLFLFPIQWEEAFGLVMIESMACGTPVVAFARGSVPEVVKDGKTGFIVNSSGDDIRGDWIIKKTGIEGLCEAVERIYAMPEGEYKQMRKNCRTHVEQNFTVEKMVDNYERVYKEILSNTDCHPRQP